MNVGEALAQTILKDYSEWSQDLAMRLLANWDPGRERWSKSMTMID